MFVARCIGVSLAVFIVLYLPLSILVSRGWKLLSRLFQPRSSQASANVLFALRVLPFVVASAVTLAFTLPSFLWLEPRSTDEAIGTAPLALGLFCLLLLAAGIFRASSAHFRTSRALVKWLDGSTEMDSSLMEPGLPSSGSAVPVFRTGNNSPTLTVAGVSDPKVLVSEAAVALLTAPELRSALRHEIAHVRSYDNLKKLLFRFSAFPGMSDLEHAWSEKAELAADDAAVSSFGDALDLAAALIKVSRLGTSPHAAALTTGLLHSSTALSARVQRLVAWKQMQPSRAGRRWLYAVPPAVATLACLVATYGSALTRMHALTEWLVR
jgi:Zn-dependent protease with chaperone function